MPRSINSNEHTIELSHLDKPYFPQDDISKWDLIAYYKRVANVMLPYLQDRPLTMQRYPDGINGEGFYQKALPDYFPKWIDSVQVPLESESETQNQVLCNDSASLIYLANQGCITPHIWLSKAGNLRQPDRLIFDLDPPDDGFDLVRAAASSLKSYLESEGFNPFLMTTGSQGLHVVVPLQIGRDFDEVRKFAKDLAKGVAQEDPDKFTIEPRKNARDGRIFIDYLRNAYGQTSVAPYAVRPLPGAPVATPLDWKELNRFDLHSQSYNIKNLFRRLGQKDDPWKEMEESSRPL